MRSTVLSVLVTSILALSSAAFAGCAPEEEDAPAEEDVGEIKKALFTNVGAFELEEKKIVAAPAKLKKLLGAITRPKEGSLRCLPMKTVTILGKSGQKMAELSMWCGTEKSTKIEASLFIERRDGLATDALPSPQRFVVQLDLSVLDEMQKAPSAVGDLLFGVDTMKLGPFGREQVTIDDRAALDSALEALAPDEVPQEGMAPRCLPNFTVNFFKGKTEVGGASSCDGGGSINMTRAKVSGGLRGIDPKKLDVVYANAK